MTQLTAEPRAAAANPFAGRLAPWHVVFGVIFVSTWCGNQFSPLLLMYERLQHYPTVLVNLFLGVYVLGLAPALLVGGALSDRYGRRPVSTCGVLVSIAAGAALACSGYGPWPVIVGRLLSGVTVGTAMAVGNSWLKELSQAPYDRRADAGSGARRASLAFTLGSGCGALVAGSIAQWGPWKEVLPFLLQIALSLPFVWLVRRLPETSPGGLPGPLRAQLRIPAAGHRRFLRVVLPAAPWVFAAAGLAYGYLPVLLAPATGRWGLAYATALTVVTLGSAALVQPLAKRIDTPSSARGLLVCLALMTGGLVATGYAQRVQSLPLGVLASVVLGLGLGIGLVSGLLEVQRIATARDLAGLTGLFYALAYVGFLAPTAMAAIIPPFTALTLFLVLAVAAALCCLAVLAAYRRHLPSR